MSYPDADDTRTTSSANASAASISSARSKASPNTTLFRIPPALKRLFDRFPLHVYPANILPLRSPNNRDRHALYIFTSGSNTSSSTSSAADIPSYNPTSLKWQTLLHIADIPFITIESTNHASPTGSLPFLIPANSAPNALPLSGGALERWIASHTQNLPSPQLELTLRERTYTTLLTHPIRLAYLYALYLHPSTFLHTTSHLYIHPASSSSFVRYCLSGPLRAAALSEITSTRASAAGRVDVERLFRDAEEAFGALAILLSSSEGPWFSGAAATAGEGSSSRDLDNGYGVTEPGGHTATASGSNEDDDDDDEFAAQGGQHRNSGFGLFDGDSDVPSRASSPPGVAAAGISSLGGVTGSSGTPGPLDAAVFSYTHVILSVCGGVGEVERDEREAWSPSARLVRAVEDAGGRGMLVRHREDMLTRYYRGYGADVKDR